GAIRSRGVLGELQHDPVGFSLRRFRTFPPDILPYFAVVRRLRNGTSIAVLIQFLVSPPTPSDVVLAQKIGHALGPGVAVLAGFSIPHGNVVLTPDVEESADGSQVVAVPVFVEYQNHIVVPGG